MCTYIQCDVVHAVLRRLPVSKACPPITAMPIQPGTAAWAAIGAASTAQQPALHLRAPYEASGWIRSDQNAQETAAGNELDAQDAAAMELARQGSLQCCRDQGVNAHDVNSCRYLQVECKRVEYS